MKTDRRQNIVLTGFMGTGKTTVGKLLAAELGYEFIDTDELIQIRHERSIPEIFSELGESIFRQMEADIARELAGKEGLVISTGGRLMLDAGNAAALSQNGHVFCLVATADEILARLSKEQKQIRRPLLEVPNPAGRIVALLQERAVAYQQFPQVPTTNKEPTEIVELLLESIQAGP